MARHFLFNDTAQPKIMGGKLVPAGEGREVDDVHLPAGEALPGVPDGDALPAAGDDDSLTDAKLQQNLLDLLAQPLSKIVPGLADHSAATLELLARLESEHQTPRKTLLGAIAQEQLTRAQAVTGAPT